MISCRLTRGLVTGCLISLGGGFASVSAGGAVSAQTGEERGYAYICDGPTQVQEVTEPLGATVVIVDGVDRPNSPDGMFEIFQASHPEKCADMAAPSMGAVPGTLLVAVTWAAPHLSIVRRCLLSSALSGIRTVCSPGTRDVSARVVKLRVLMAGVGIGQLKRFVKMATTPMPEKPATRLRGPTGSQPRWRDGPRSDVCSRASPPRRQAGTPSRDDLAGPNGPPCGRCPQS